MLGTHSKYLPDSIRFSPPLAITETEADTALAIFAHGLGKVETRPL